MIIDASYFVGSIYLPQVGLGASTIANNDDKLQFAIDQYEVEILVKGLGRKLCNEFYSNLETNGTVKSGADPKWGKLLNGDEYNDKYWRGLIDQTGTLKQSLMAYYIYHEYVRESATATTVMGVKKGKTQNTTGASATTKLVKSWRELHKWYCGNHDSYHQSYIYKGMLVEDFHGGDNTNNVSLFTYMQDHATDFSDWSFSSIGENVNDFGV